MKKIKVLQLAEDLKVGGMENVVAAIARGLDREKYDLEVWCVARGGEIADELEKEGITVRILNISTYHNPLNILKLVFLLRKAGIDMIQTHGYFSSVIGRIAAKIAGVKIIINHVHSTYFEYRKRHVLMEKFLSTFTDKIISCSKAVEGFIREHEKIDPLKTVVIYNGVDTDRFFNVGDISEEKEQLKIKPDDSIIGIVASLTPNKGHKYLFSAAARLLPLFPKTKLLIIGNGYFKEELQKEARKLGITPQVIFAGARRDIPEVLSMMDIFVLTSCEREGLGISVIEAMAAGKPVIANSIGGIPEVVKHGVNGILVPPKDPKALSEAIIALLKDKQMAKQMGKEGQNISKQRFSSEIMLEEIEKLYNTLLDAKGLQKK